ncbi:MAG: hypothetical protein NDI61_01940 [Bdellovibrionaceae bacterium]|nr:hypothetical protein [Pseudobdellovibrionaceae bacterium]
MDTSISLGMPVGTVNLFLNLNGAIPIPRGWMKLNGNQVTEAAYDTIHGSGAATADQLSVFPYFNKYLPNMDGKYPCGSILYTSVATSPISSFGNTLHMATTDGHNHKWYIADGVTEADSIINSAGNFTDLTTANTPTKSGVNAVGIVTQASATFESLPDAYTSVKTDTVNVQPESHSFLFIIKVCHA